MCTTKDSVLSAVTSNKSVSPGQTRLNPGIKQSVSRLTETRVHYSQQLAQVPRLQIKPGRRWNLTFPHSANTEDTVQTSEGTFPLQQVSLPKPSMISEGQILGFSTIGFLSAFNLFKCIEDPQSGDTVTSVVHTFLITELFSQRLSHTAGVPGHAVCKMLSHTSPKDPQG